MNLKWCSAGLTAMALLCGAVWYAHTAATGFSWDDNDAYPWFINGLESKQSASVWWKPYKRHRDAIDLCLHHATFALAIGASLSLLGLTCRTTYRELTREQSLASRRVAGVLLSASTVVGSAFLVFVVMLYGSAGTRLVWTCPHPAVRRLHEVWQARQSLGWPLDNGMTTTDIAATCPGHHLVPYKVPEELEESWREKPSDYRDTDLFYFLTSRSGHGLLNLLLQFRDDRLINFDRVAFRREAKLLMEGKDPYSPTIQVCVEGR
jgi:hypothetical protein